MQFTAAILNGGKASRMSGKPKDLLWLQNSNLINKQIAILSLVFDDIIIIGKPVINSNISNIHEDIYKGSGPLGGLHSAIKNAKNKHIFLFSCDMPFLSIDLITSMIKAEETSPSQALVPIHNGGVEPLHAIYHKSTLASVNYLLENKKYRFQSIYNYIETSYFHIGQNHNPDEVFFNINKPEDLIKAKEYARNIIK